MYIHINIVLFLVSNVYYMLIKYIYSTLMKYGLHIYTCNIYRYIKVYLLCISACGKITDQLTFQSADVGYFLRVHGLTSSLHLSSRAGLCWWFASTVKAVFVG